MEAIVEYLLDNILYFENEQNKVVSYVQELVLRRSQLLFFVGSLTDGILTRRAKEKLSNKIVKMRLVAGISCNEESQTRKGSEKKMMQI